VVLSGRIGNRLAPAQTRGFDPPAFPADSFPAIEINSTFYHRLRTERTLLWAERVRGEPESRFAVMLERLWRIGLKAPALFVGLEEK